MPKKSLLILLLIGSTSGIHGWLGGGSSDTSQVPLFSEKIKDQFTLDDAQSHCATLLAFIEAKKTAAKVCDLRMEDILDQLHNTIKKEKKPSDQLEELSNKLPPQIKYRKKLEKELDLAEATLDALQAQIKCYLEKHHSQVDAAFTLNKQNNLDSSDLTKEADFKEEQ